MMELIKKTYEITTEIEPGLSLLKDVISWGDKKFTERRDKVLLEFYQNILDGNVNKKRIEYEKNNIQANEEQFYILLNLAINEDELDKTSAYANTFKYIRNNPEMDKKEKVKFIKLVKNLPYSAIEIIQYIHTNPEKKDLNELLFELEENSSYELDILSNVSILHKESIKHDFINGILYINKRRA